MDGSEIQEERVAELHDDSIEQAAWELVDTASAREDVKGSEELVRQYADQFCDDEIARLQLGGSTPAEIAAWGPAIAQESIKQAARMVRDAYVFKRAYDRA